MECHKAGDHLSVKCSKKRERGQHLMLGCLDAGGWRGRKNAPRSSSARGERKARGVASRQPRERERLAVSGLVRPCQVWVAKTERSLGLNSTEVVGNLEIVNRRVGRGSGNGQECGWLLQREGGSSWRGEQGQDRCFWSENGLFLMLMVKSTEGKFGDGTSFLTCKMRTLTAYLPGD